MRPFKTAPLAVLVLAASLLPSGRVLAEDTKGKWQFGFGLSYFATVDYIRSNSDIALAEGVIGPNGLPSVGSVDERPDINIMNQASVRDDFKLDFSASYGLTRWFALEAGASYMNAPVGNIEFYTKDAHQGISSPLSTDVSSCGSDPASTARCTSWTPQTPDNILHNTFLPIGTITEIPIHLSGLIRFRPESPFDPYIGAGFGYIMANLKTGDDFNRAAATFADPAFIVTNASEGEFTDNNRCNRLGFPYNPVTRAGEGCTNFHPDPLEANVNNTWEWHAIGGVDYYTSDHFSVYVDARYVWTSGSVDIRTDNAHQVRFALADSGQLLLQTRAKGTAAFDPDDPSTWLLWEDIGVEANRHFHQDICPECQNNGTLETEDKNMNGSLDARCDPNIPNDFCEDEGVLYRLLPGSRDVDEALKIDCPACRHNWDPGTADPPTPLDDVGFDTEDANHNGYLDRFYVYGIDICTTDRARGNPRCGIPPNPPFPDNNNNVSYIWPEGCPQTEAQLSPFQTLKESGCPPFPAVIREEIVNPNTGQVTVTYRRPSVGNTGADNAADVIIVQGGRIRLGGFSLGVGFKFTF